ncbi:MAG: class I SAM-dependent methyltransferase [Solirubrobacteraceae bacterium]
MEQILQRGIRAGRRLTLKLGTRPVSRHALVGRPHLWAMKRRFQFEFLISRGLKPEQRLLDIGCGTLRGGIPVIEYLQPGHYVGIEAREDVLEEGRRELAEAGLEDKQPLLIHSTDLTRVQLADPVQLAWAFSVLIHMSDEILDACLGLVARVLAEGGEFYANVVLGTRPEGHWQGFPVVARNRDFYETVAARHGLAIDEVGTLESLGHKTGTSQDQGTMLRFTRSGATRSS